MAFRGQTGVTKLDYARMAAAALAYLIAGQGDAVGLAIYDETVRQYVPSRIGQSHLRAVLAALARMQTSGTTSGARSLRRSVDLLTRRGVVILISDLYDDEEAVEAELRRAVRMGHEVAVFHVLTRDELEFPFGAGGRARRPRVGTASADGLGGGRGLSSCVRGVPRTVACALRARPDRLHPHRDRPAARCRAAQLPAPPRRELPRDDRLAECRRTLGAAAGGGAVPHSSAPHASREAGGVSKPAIRAPSRTAAVRMRLALGCAADAGADRDRGARRRRAGGTDGVDRGAHGGVERADRARGSRRRQRQHARCRRQRGSARGRSRGSRRGRAANGDLCQANRHARPRGRPGARVAVAGREPTGAAGDRRDLGPAARGIAPARADATAQRGSACGSFRSAEPAKTKTFDGRRFSARATSPVRGQAIEATADTTAVAIEARAGRAMAGLRLIAPAGTRAGRRTIAASGRGCRRVRRAPPSSQWPYSSPALGFEPPRPRAHQPRVDAADRPAPARGFGARVSSSVSSWSVAPLGASRGRSRPLDDRRRGIAMVKPRVRAARSESELLLDVAAPLESLFAAAVVRPR